MPAVSISLFEASFKPPSRRLKEKKFHGNSLLGELYGAAEPR